MRTLAFALSVLALSCIHATAAQMTIAQAATGNVGYVNIFGTIASGDAARFGRITDKLVEDGRTALTVNICSPGGDLGEASRIGAQISRLGASTKAPDLIANLPATTVQCWLTGPDLQPDIRARNIDTGEGDADVGCGSACFLVWVGGATREGNFVGLSPIARDGSNLGDRGITASSLRSYLSDRQIPSSIVDVMLGDGSETTHYLDEAELTLTRRLPRVAPREVQAAPAPIAPVRHVETQAMVVPAKTDMAEPVPATYWDFWGSRMSMIAHGSMRSISYDVPRKTVDRQGIKSGTIFFSGSTDGPAVRGTAMAYAKDCPTLSYPVTGSVSPDGKHIVLKGARPSRNAECEVTFKDVTIQLDELP